MLPTPSSYPITEPSMAYSPLPQGVEIPNRVFVGGLAYNTTELELKNFFNQFGYVKDSKIITDRQGVSRGYGFVTFSTVEEAIKVQEQGYLYYNEKKLNVSKAIRKQGGQYSSPNQEYINGQWYGDSTSISDQEGAWLMGQHSNKQPFTPIMFSMYQPTTSHTGYHGNPSPLFSPAHYYHVPPMYNGFYPTYLQHSSYRSSPAKEHFSESLTSGEDSEEQDNDLAELEAQTQQLTLKDDSDDDNKQDHVIVKRSRRLPRLRKPPHFFQPNNPFHPTAHQIMSGPGGYAPLLPTPHHMIQPLPPRYLQQHGMITANLN